MCFQSLETGNLQAMERVAEIVKVCEIYSKSCSIFSISPQNDKVGLHKKLERISILSLKLKFPLFYVNYTPAYLNVLLSLLFFLMLFFL